MTSRLAARFMPMFDADSLGIEISPENYGQLIHAGKQIKRAVMDSYEIKHPDGDPDLNFLYGTILVTMLDEIHSRNVCIFADGEVDRCPHRNGREWSRGHSSRARANWTLTKPSPSRASSARASPCESPRPTMVGDLPAIIPEVSGTAHITGMNTFLIDPDDPLKDGFLLR